MGRLIGWGLAPFPFKDISFQEAHNLPIVVCVMSRNDVSMLCQYYLSEVRIPGSCDFKDICLVQIHSPAW